MIWNWNPFRAAISGSADQQRKSQFLLLLVATVVAAGGAWYFLSWTQAVLVSAVLVLLWVIPGLQKTASYIIMGALLAGVLIYVGWTYVYWPSYIGYGIAGLILFWGSMYFLKNKWIGLMLGLAIVAGAVKLILTEPYDVAYYVGRAYDMVACPLRGLKQCTGQEIKALRDIRLDGRRRAKLEAERAQSVMASAGNSTKSPEPAKAKERPQFARPGETLSLFTPREQQKPPAEVAVKAAEAAVVKPAAEVPKPPAKAEVPKPAPAKAEAPKPAPAKAEKPKQEKQKEQKAIAAKPPAKVAKEKTVTYLPLVRKGEISSPKALATRMRVSLTKDGTGRTRILGANVTPNELLAAVQKAGGTVTGVEGLPLYLENLIEGDMPSGKLTMSRVKVMHGKASKVIYGVDLTVGHAREAHKGERGWFDANTGNFILAGDCSNTPLREILGPVAERKPEPKPVPAAQPPAKVAEPVIPDAPLGEVPKGICLIIPTHERRTSCPE